MSQSTDQLEADLDGLLTEARRIGHRIYAGETIPPGEMDAYYTRRADLDERLDAHHRERLR